MWTNKPKLNLCRLCGREYGTYSLGYHLKTCSKRPKTTSKTKNKSTKSNPKSQENGRLPQDNMNNVRNKGLKSLKVASEDVLLTKIQAELEEQLHWEKKGIYDDELNIGDLLSPIRLDKAGETLLGDSGVSLSFEVDSADDKTLTDRLNKELDAIDLRSNLVPHSPRTSNKLPSNSISITVSSQANNKSLSGSTPLSLAQTVSSSSSPQTNASNSNTEPHISSHPHNYEQEKKPLSPSHAALSTDLSNLSSRQRALLKSEQSYDQTRSKPLKSNKTKPLIASSSATSQDSSFSRKQTSRPQRQAKTHKTHTSRTTKTSTKRDKHRHVNSRSNNHASSFNQLHHQSSSARKYTPSPAWARTGPAEYDPPPQSQSQSRAFHQRRRASVTDVYDPSSAVDFTTLLNSLEPQVSLFMPARSLSVSLSLSLSLVPFGCWITSSYIYICMYKCLANDAELDAYNPSKSYSSYAGCI